MPCLLYTPVITKAHVLSLREKKSENNNAVDGIKKPSTQKLKKGKQNMTKVRAGSARPENNVLKRQCKRNKGKGKVEIFFFFILGIQRR